MKSLLNKIKKSYRFFTFVENRLIKYIMSLLLIVLVLFKILNMFSKTNILLVNKVNTFISEVLTKSFIDRDSTLIT
uniref:hypothetical protein n=1 Tax=Escherichia coli TaxID=562 RepID=UPI001CCE7315